ncbi:putative 2-aminoethylphosphonate ABC transporter permease subunit [Pelagimonas sp. KU-00592-HH]|uniref:putative 2-aminoethylphosphonate ABC transporter permease subunit n=1 Tax=Pelagimonas sp. KU-00592-HH TaxID=3127651 RepID=UPI0033408E65
MTRFRDETVLRLGLLVVALYLLVALVLPLGAILGKSMTTYRFDLSKFEIMVSDEAGVFGGAVLNAAEVNAALGVYSEGDIVTGRDGRLSPVALFPDFSFRSPVKYRVRGINGGQFLVGAAPHGADWVEVDSNTFRRVQLRPDAARGFGNFARYFSSPALAGSIINSLVVATISTVVTVALAFWFAYAVQRSRMWGRGLFRMVAMAPLLVPSLLPGIALIYLFGNQGMLKGLLMGESIYGPIGIVIGSVFFTFPHAFLILSTALSLSDARLYEAAEALGASKGRMLRTVTLPGARYGLISAGFVVFNLVITDFGLPKVIGGQFNVLAVDIYKQVIGQQNFEMGAVVSVILLIPAGLAFVVDRIVQRRQVAALSERAVPYVAAPSRGRDRVLLVHCGMVSLFILGVLGVCQYAALVRFWPYDLSLTWQHFRFDLVDGGGWASYWNSLRLAVLVAGLGTVLIFVGAYLVEKAPGMGRARGTVQAMALMPMAVPGMVLGLAYIFFFNAPGNPLGGIYGTMAILVICTVAHFYTVAHLTAVTALKQMDGAFEAASASLGQPVVRLFLRVTVPVSLPAALEIGIYLFVNAMTTVSAVVFLYSPKTTLASVAVLNMDDAGDVAPAAAMGMLIFYTNLAARGLYAGIARGLLARTQGWR